MRYQAQRTEFFVTSDNFLPIYPLKTRKIKILKKWKKHLEILSFYKTVAKIRIVCYTALEIWHVTDLFFILDYFLPFYHPNSLKNDNFKKFEKNTWRCYHFTKVYQKLWSYGILFLRCGTWQRHDRGNWYFSFWVIFCPFTPLTAQKIKISKQWKKNHLEISSFKTSVPKIMIRWCRVPKKWCATDGQIEKVTHRGGCPT